MKSAMIVSVGNQQQAGQEPRHDQVVNRIGAHAGQGVDLLGDAHRAQFGGHGAADAAGQHRGRQHRPQLAHQRHVDHRAQPRFQMQEPELRVALHRQHHADERARQRHHRQAQHADLIEVRQQRVAARHARDDPRERPQKELRDIAHGNDPIQHQSAQVGNPIDGSLREAAPRARLRGKLRCHDRAKMVKRKTRGRTAETVSRTGFETAGDCPDLRSPRSKMGLSPSPKRF